MSTKKSIPYRTCNPQSLSLPLNTVNSKMKEAENIPYLQVCGGSSQLVGNLPLPRILPFEK